MVIFAEHGVKDPEKGAGLPLHASHAVPGMTSPVCNGDVALIPRHDDDDDAKLTTTTYDAKQTTELGRDLYTNGHSDPPELTRYGGILCCCDSHPLPPRLAAPFRV